MGKLKKICFVISDFTTTGGIETITNNLSKELSIYYKVFIYSFRKKNKNIKIEKNTNITIKFEKFKNKLLRNIDLFCYLSLSRKFSCIIFQGFGTLANTPHLFFKSKLNILFNDHANVEDEHRNIGNYYLNYLKYLSDNNKKFIFLTKYSKKYIERKLNNNIHATVIPNFINICPCKYFNESKEIVLVSRIDNGKNCFNLIKKFDCVFSKHPEWKLNFFYIACKKTEEEEIKNYIKNSSFKYNYLLTKNENRKDIIYRAKSFVIFPSISEGFPMVLLEALSYKLPVVAFNINNVNEIVQNNVNGYLCKENDFDDFIEKVIYLIEHDDIRLKFTNNAQKSIEKYETKNVINKWIELLG